MPDGLVISIDAMGGDHAPDIVLEGVEIAARRRPDARFFLHGPHDRLTAMLAERPAAKAACEVFDSSLVVAMDAKPSQALRQGRGTTMWNAIQAVEQGLAHAAVSAGNTGALMAMSKLRLRMVEGVHRPAMVVGVAGVGPLRRRPDGRRRGDIGPSQLGQRRDRVQRAADVAHMAADTGHDLAGPAGGSSRSAWPATSSPTPPAWSRRGPA